MTEHVHGATPKVYFIVYAILVVLLIATVAVYNFQLGTFWAIAFAMIIAVTKALLVVLFFMQVYYSTRLTWVWAALGFIWLGFMGGIIVDYASRTYRMGTTNPLPMQTIPSPPSRQ